MEATVSSCRSLLICAGAFLLIAGCGGYNADVSAERMKSMTGNDSRKLVPVSGKVTIDGQPKEGVALAFYVDSPTGTAVANDARTKADGTYCLNTYAECDGIPAGKYKVAFKLVPKPGRNDNVTAADDQFKGKFADHTKSKYTLEVKDGAPMTDANFDLKTK